MVGGGKDAFIGAIHRIAASMDGLIELSCGALSINPEIAKDSARSLFLPEDRCYTTYDEMIKAESKLPADKRMESAMMVQVMFLSACDVKAPPSTTNKLSQSCAWLNLFSADRFGSLPMRTVPASWMIRPGASSP